MRLELQLELFGEIDDADVGRLFAHAPLSVGLRRLLITLSLRRGQTRDALDHLAVLERLTEPSERERNLAAKLREELKDER